MENTSTISLCKEPIQGICMKISEQTVVAFVERFFCIYTKPINHGNVQSDNSDPKTSEKYADKIRSEKFIFSWQTWRRIWVKPNVSFSPLCNTLLLKLTWRCRHKQKMCAHPAPIKFQRLFHSLITHPPVLKLSQLVNCFNGFVTARVKSA